MLKNCRNPLYYILFNTRYKHFEWKLEGITKEVKQGCCEELNYVIIIK